MSIVLKCWRRHGWVAESRMAIGIRRQSLSDVVPRRVESVMESTLCDLSVCRRRWRCSIYNRPRVRTTGNSERQCQYSKCECFAHFSFLEFSTVNLPFRVPGETLSGSNTDLRRVLLVESMLMFRAAAAQCCSSEPSGFRNLATPDYLDPTENPDPGSALGVIVAREFSPTHEA
jgi:hypothetical protein